MYQSLIRSKLDYGSQVYGFVRKSKPLALDRIQLETHQLATGASRISPTETLQLYTSIMTLKGRRDMQNIINFC